MPLWRKLLPTPLWPRWVIVPALAFLATVSDRHYLADFWHHLARGRAMVQEAGLVDRDVFTFTVTDKPFRDVNWLTQIAYYWLFEAGGLPLVQVVNSAVIALTFLLLVNLCRRRAGALNPAVIAAGLAFFGVWEVLTIRPQTLSMLLFVVVLDCLERSQLDEKKGTGTVLRSTLRAVPETVPVPFLSWPLLPIPALIALWTNLHGAFPAGIMLVGCFGLAAACTAWKQGRRPWRDHRVLALGGCLGACLLATAVNPYGFAVLHYVGGTSAVAYQRQIAEWIRPEPGSLIGLVWLASTGMVFALMAWRWRATGHTPSLPDVLVLGCFLFLSVGAVRMVAWWMLIMAPILAELLAWAVPHLVIPNPDDRRPSLAAAAMCGVIGLALLFSLPELNEVNPLLGPTRRGQRVEDDLEAATRQLAATYPHGNVYSHFEWGEYLSWSATPQHRIFMDGRIEIYPDDVWDKYTTVTFAKEKWQDVLDQYKVEYLLLDANWHGRTGLVAAVSQSPDWQLAFQSRSALLFVRKSTALARS